MDPASALRAFLISTVPFMTLIQNDSGSSHVINYSEPFVTYYGGQLHAQDGRTEAPDLRALLAVEKLDLGLGLPWQPVL